MNAYPNIERRDSGPRHLDKTADEEIGYEAAYAERFEAHTKLFDACDLSELADDNLLALVKAGKAEAAGRYLIDSFRARVGDRADWAVGRFGIVTDSQVDGADSMFGSAA